MKKFLSILTLATLATAPLLWAQPKTESGPNSTPARRTVGVPTLTTPEPSLLEKGVDAGTDATTRRLVRGMKNATFAAPLLNNTNLQRAPMPDPTLKFWGLVGYSDHNEAGTMNAHRGFYLIDGVGNLTKLDSYPVHSSPSSTAAYTDDGRVIMQDRDSYRIFSTDTWSEMSIDTYPSNDYRMYSATWDPYTNGLLACVYTTSNQEYPYTLVTIDPSTWLRREIVKLVAPLYAIALDPTGKIYALDQDFNFKTIGRDGTVTVIKEKIVPFVLDKAFGGGAMTWDPIRGRLITGIRGITDEPMASADPFPGCLYSIDPATGDATLIVQFTYNDELCALAFPEGMYGQSAPGKACNLVTTFSAGSMEGTVAFNAPTVAIDGTPLSGTLDYTIYSDAVPVTTGTAAPGEARSINVTAPASGSHTISVQFAANGMNGPVVGNTLFIGTDVPNAPEWITAQLSSSGLLLLNWEKVESAANGGYIDTEKVTYKVRRYNVTNPEEEAEDWAETELTNYSKPMPEPETLTDYRFGITATYDGKTSPEVFSNTVRAGSFVSPFAYDFSDQDDFKNVFTLINYNTDSYGDWSWSYEGWGATKNGYANCRRGYGASGDVDKWLITPRFRFEKDKVYRFDIDVKSSNSRYNEQIEVLIGTDVNSPDTWSTYVIRPTDFNSTNWTTLTGYINVPSSGIYYVGIHACTPASRNTYTIMVDNLSIGEGVKSTAPGSASALEVKAGPLGTHYCDISFTAPTKNFMQTENLTSLSEIKVLRNGEVAKTFTNPALGTTLNFHDDNLAPGEYTYSVVTVNENGEGPSVSDKVFVGVPLPARTANIDFTESTDTPGQVTITWTPVTTDVNGATIPSEFVSYALVELQGNNQIWIADVKDNTYTYQAVASDATQQFKRYAVFAETESGTGYGLPTTAKPVGNPITLPLRESFANAGVDIPILRSSNAWGTLLDGDIANGPVAVDGDNGYACMIASYQNEVADLYTGKIDLRGTSNPLLTFWTYNIVPASGIADLNEFRILVSCDGEEMALKSFAVAQECRHEGWNRVLVDLKPYAGKVVQIGFRAMAVNYGFTLLDDVRVYDAPAHDLMVKDFTAPTEVKADTDFRLRVVIENYGATTENDYTINIFRDGNKVLTAPGKTVSPTQTIFADFTESIPVLETAGEHIYHAELAVTDEATPDDNISADAALQLRLPKYPEVQNLTGEQVGDDVQLNWNRPEIDRNPEAVTEDFEGYDCMTQYLDEWTTLDLDEYPIYGFQDFKFPGIPAGAPQAWFLIDNSRPEFAGINTFEAHSGTKCMVQFLPEEATCDDWLISPALRGTRQEIDFYARSYFPGNLCQFEFLYTSQEPGPWGFYSSMFSSVGSMKISSEEWTHYTFEVPAGTKYFAIRAYGNAGVMLMVDDITYRPLGNSDLALSGYNVYHNGTKVNDEIIPRPGYLHVSPEKEVDHTYAVTAVYTKGESVPVETSLALSGLSGISNSNTQVAVEGRNIIVSNAQGKDVRVVTTAGLTIYLAPGKSHMSIPVGAPGVYLVTAGNETHKVAVR